jgi:hypothetical protein
VIPQIQFSSYGQKPAFFKYKMSGQRLMYVSKVEQGATSVGRVGLSHALPATQVTQWTQVV